MLFDNQRKMYIENNNMPISISENHKPYFLLLFIRHYLPEVRV